LISKTTVDNAAQRAFTGTVSEPRDETTSAESPTGLRSHAAVVAGTIVAVVLALLAILVLLPAALAAQAAASI
jgi:hypothetical protein